MSLYTRPWMMANPTSIFWDTTKLFVNMTVKDEFKFTCSGSISFHFNEAITQTNKQTKNVKGGGKDPFLVDES